MKRSSSPTGNGTLSITPYVRRGAEERGGSTPSEDARCQDRLLQSGFTLLEITLVLLIISVMATIVAPRLQDAGKLELRSQASRLQRIFRWLRSEAVLRGTAYRLNYDLDSERYWITPDESGGDLESFASDFGSLARETQIKSPVEIMDVELPMSFGKVAQGQASTVFFPDGQIEPTVIHLGDGKRSWTLCLNPLGQKLEYVDTYTTCLN